MSWENASARIRYFFSDTESGLVCGNLGTVEKGDAGPGIVRQQEVAVEVDVITERRDLRGRCNAEAGLDHAAEHDAEPERTRGVSHPDCLADATGLRELDVDAVRSLCARGDVLQPMAVLVQVDGNRGLGLQTSSARVAGGQRLLAVVHAELGELLEGGGRLRERSRLRYGHLRGRLPG